MNYLPFTGSWFYGAGLITSKEMAARYSSWGLLASAPIPIIGEWREQGILSMLL
jgi:hypothetical protein